METRVSQEGNPVVLPRFNLLLKTKIKPTMIIYADPNEAINNRLIKACKDGDLDIVKYCLTSPELKSHADIHYKDEEAFTNACDKGHLHIIKYLLTSPELKEHIILHTYNDLGFVLACENNHIELVKYFLTDIELVSHADIHTYSNYSLKEICKRGYLELLEYLTSSIEINHRYEQKDWPIGFSEACRHNRYDILRYFIFNLAYEITEDELKNLPEEVKNMFELRRLNARLKTNLKVNNQEKEQIIKI